MTLKYKNRKDHPDTGPAHKSKRKLEIFMFLAEKRSR